MFNPIIKNSNDERKIPLSYLKIEDDCTTYNTIRRHNGKREKELASLQVIKSKIKKEKCEKTEEILKLHEKADRLRSLIQSKKNEIECEKTDLLNPMQLLTIAKGRNCLGEFPEIKQKDGVISGQTICLQDGGTPIERNFEDKNAANNQWKILDLQLAKSGTMINFITNVASSNN